MIKTKVFEVSDLPDEFHKELYEKIQHCGGSCKWYPGDGYFKPLDEVRDISKIHFCKNEDENTKDVFVYEEGDDLIGDWFMKNKIKLIEEVLIIR